MSVRTGSCLCGSIKVEIRGDPISKTRCHCVSCQKTTATLFAASVIYEIENVTWTESEPSVMKTYEDLTPESGNVLTRCFCGRCGCAVRIVIKSNPNLVVVPVGIIDGDKAAFKPQKEYYCRNRVDWVEAVEGALQFTTMPPKLGSP